jgi:hypothetical protein
MINAIAELRSIEFPALLAALARITGVSFRPDQKPIWAVDKEVVSGEIHFVVSTSEDGTTLIVTRGNNNAIKLAAMVDERFPKASTHVVSLRQVVPLATNA